jgi:hypothetical protein
VNLQGLLSWQRAFVVLLNVTPVRSQDSGLLYHMLYKLCHIYAENINRVVRLCMCGARGRNGLSLGTCGDDLPRSLNGIKYASYSGM